ncbi:hypothetical protein F5Y16DRAFT_392734 [Xylariaceae sp. FL0255]|nr:hypothetical protein F5Y16DRAFT_392734 [Xylariaceae sp. FL0255]
MSNESFQLFSCLPAELRIMIYWLATPPRFVHVLEEHEDEEDFHERFRTTPVQLRIHPSIASFVNNWRNRVPTPYRRGWNLPRNRYQQQPLEAYGFSGGRPRHQPWQSTENLPGIPHIFLADNSSVAWEFVRSGFFYSCAPIPAMLQVCRESRQFLMDTGYELTFRTRTCGPRVWFNYKRDVLYLSRYSRIDHEGGDAPHSLLSGNSFYDLGQFETDDLRRVRRLCLGHASYLDGPTPVTDITHSLCSVLPMFTDLEELFLEESGPDDLVDILGNSRFFDYNLNTVSHESEIWCYTPTREVDVLAYPLLYNPLVGFSGECGMRVQSYHSDNMKDNADFFDDYAVKIETRLKEAMSKGIIPHKPDCSWKTLKVRVVHIAYPSVCEELFKKRWLMWNYIQNLKSDDTISRAQEAVDESMNTVPKRHIYSDHELADRPVSPFTERYADDLEEYEAICLDQFYDYYDYRYEREAERQAYLGLNLSQPA